MADHIHVHVHTSRTADAGFDAARHKRDSDGRFTSSSGLTAAQHLEEAKRHSDAPSNIKKNPNEKHHTAAIHHHSEAASYLQQARRTHNNPNAGAPSHVWRAMADEHAKAAAYHESLIKHHPKHAVFGGKPWDGSPPMNLPPWAPR